MFTGIIQTIGEVISVDHSRSDLRLYVKSSLDLTRVYIGASLCHAGCFLTVVEKNGNLHAVDVSAETLSKTTLGQWNEGKRINLEPSLKMGDELGGHMVSGHVDGVATIVSIKPVGGSRLFVIEAPQELARFIAPKGSVSLDGVSLTVNEVDGHRFTVNATPHIWQITTLGQAREGDRLNIEIDMIARYVARLMEYQ